MRGLRGIEVFRDALLELFASELGEEVFTPDIRVNLARRGGISMVSCWV